MREEMDYLIENDTIVLTTLPAQHDLILHLLGVY